MKKILLLFIPFLLIGCMFDEKEVKEKERVVSEKNKIEKAPEYVDDNPIKLGIFLVDNNYYNKSVIEDTYYANFTNRVDIASFEVFFTDDKVINGSNFKNTWNKYYSMYDNIDDYKIGYNIKFTLEDGTSYDGNFLEPDNFKFIDYFYVYLYDDVNQKDGAFYSHLEKINDNTLITSIKLYAVGGIDKVEEIDLSAFTYNGEDDFDKDGNYRGNSKYTIKIKKQ